MVRRRKIPVAQSGPESVLLEEMLRNVDSSWAERYRFGSLDRLDPDEFDRLLIYLGNVYRNTSFFIPAREPDYGISERGGDAILGYLRNPDGSCYLFFADVSGFTALLTFLTDRFGKEEAGDIMNLGILNRFCLDKMGLVLDHFKNERKGRDKGAVAFKVMLSIRASMPLITRQVRQELHRKLSGKPHQDEIRRFVDQLEVKASGGLVYDPEPKSGFYGTRVMTRITWGDSGKLVAKAEKLGGDDSLVEPGLQEVKGFGIDEHCYAKLDELYRENWLGLGPQDLAVSGPQGHFRKVVIRPSGMKKIVSFVDELCQSRTITSDFSQELAAHYLVMDPREKQRDLATLAAGFLELERYLGNRQLLLHIQRNLGPGGKKNILLDEQCSSIRDSGILFCNFMLSDTSLLSSLVDEVHQVMVNYGIHYKYNIFPKGDFNLMGVLGTAFSTKRDMDRYYAEILWNTWVDLKRTVQKAFDGQVQVRGGISVGKGLQGPAGDNIIHNEETIIAPDCNLAARLVNEALEQDRRGNFVHPSGTIFTVDSHRQKIVHLIHPQPPVREAGLKGFRKPVSLYSLTERHEMETLAEFLDRLRRVSLVTVEGEVVRDESSMRKDSFLRRCLEIFEKVAEKQTDRSQLIAFVAPSGVGKTRRIAELAHWAATREIPVYFGECYSWYQGGGAEEQHTAVRPDEAETHSDEGAYPYYPFIRILKEQIFQVNNVDTPETKREKIARVLSVLDPDNPDLAGQAPVLGSFIGVDVPETAFSSALDPEERRNIFYERTGDIFAHRLKLQGAGGAVMICIDDLQWADRNSLHLASYILRKLGPGLILSVNARKKKQLGILLDEDLPVERHFFQPGLLQTSAIVNLARLVLGIDTREKKYDLPLAVREKVEKELEGNPFFVLEFCLKILEQEIVTVVDGRCVRFDTERFVNVAIPTKIQGVIEDRISRLPRTELTAIQYSSILGNILRYIIIRQFLPAVDEDKLFADSDLAEIFSRLTGHDITRLENEKDPEWVYSFKRALIGEKLYQELVPSLRKKLHGEVARIFENTSLTNLFEKTLLTALHYSNAEVPDKSCEFYLQAGNLARRVFDNERSLLLFDRIEKILEEYEVSNPDLRKMVLFENRGQVNLLLGRYDKALEDFSVLASRAGSAGDMLRLGRAHHLMGQAYFQRSLEGDFDRAIEHFAQAAASTDDQRLLAEIYNDQARTCLEKGEREMALELLDQAGEAFRRATADSAASPEDRIFTATLMRNRGSVFHRQGQFKKAVDLYQQALALVDDPRENRFKKIRAMLYNSIGLSTMKQFRLDESMPFFEKALDLARSIGDMKTELQVRINLGVVYNDLGQNREALKMLSEQHDMLKMLVGETRELAALEFNIGESHMFMEHFAEAEPWYSRALDLAVRIGYKEFEVGARYNLGEVLHTLGRSGEALGILEKGFEMAQKGGWDLQRMDLANLLGEIQRELGDYKAARQFHEQALELSRELEDVFGMGWALRNMAVDILQDPGSAGEQVEACAAMLEDSVKLTREAGQPENLMYSLRELIRYRLERRSDTSEQARKLYRELRELAGKTGSKQFGDFCDSVAGKLSD